MLRKSGGDAIGKEVFGNWLAQQIKTSSASSLGPVVVKIEAGLVDFVDGSGFRLRNYGYTIRRARGKEGIGITGIEER